MGYFVVCCDVLCVDDDVWGDVCVLDVWYNNCDDVVDVWFELGMKCGNVGDGKCCCWLGKMNKVLLLCVLVVECDVNDDLESDVSDEDVKFVWWNVVYVLFIVKGSFEEEEGGKWWWAGRERDVDDDDLEGVYVCVLVEKWWKVEEEKKWIVNLLDEEKLMWLLVKWLDGTVVRDAVASLDASASDEEEVGGRWNDVDEGEGWWKNVGDGEGKGLGKKVLVREIWESDFGWETMKLKKNEKWWEKREEEEVVVKVKVKKCVKGDFDSVSDLEDVWVNDLVMKFVDKCWVEWLVFEAEMSVEARRESVKVRIALMC